jgi:multiple sugar transport system substrate-binding protein
MSERKIPINEIGVSRRDFLRLTSLTSAGVLLAACAPASAPAAQPGSEGAAVSAAPVEIRVQDWGGDWAQVAAAQFETFEAQNPDIQIEYEPYQDGWEERTLAAMVAGDAPDIIHAWGDVFTSFADRGQLVNLDPLFNETYSNEEKGDFHDYQIRSMIRDGFRWAMPKHVWLGILYYNKDWYDEAGVPYPTKEWTHDDYSEALEALTIRNEAGEATAWGGFIPAWGYDRIVPKIQAWGGNAVDQETYTRSLLHEPPAQEALEWVRSRMWDTNTVAQQLQVENRNGYDSLISKLVATAEEGTSHLVRVGNNFEGNFDIAHHPIGPDRRVSLGGTNGYAIYKGAVDRNQVDQTWTVMQFLVSPEFQKEMLAAESRTIVPARLSVVPDFLESIKRQAPALENVNVNVILEALEEGYPEAIDPQTFKNHAAAAEIITPALESLYVVGNAPVTIFVDRQDQINATQN